MVRRSSNLKTVSCLNSKPSTSGGGKVGDSALLRDDIWLRDLCLVCQTSYSTQAEKLAHVRTDKHSKRVCVYDFFSKESASMEPVTDHSVLLNRYQKSHVLAIGLECIHEFIMPFSDKPWWACSICYIAGSNLDDVDDHLHSITHQKTYFDEFYPAYVEVAGLEKDVLVDRLVESGMKLLEEQGELKPPEILSLKAPDKKWACEKLGINESSEKVGYLCASVLNNYEAVYCKACTECFLCPKTELERCWATHLETISHQRLQIIASLLRQFEYEECSETFNGILTMNDWRQNQDGVYFGPLVGRHHLVFFGEEPYCSLCYAVLTDDGIVDHFRSEKHVMNYLTSQVPAQMYLLAYLPEDARRNEMQVLLEKLVQIRSGGAARKLKVKKMPDVIRSNSNSNLLAPTTAMPPVLPLGFDKQCYWCPVCWKVIEVSNDNDPEVERWVEHCTKDKEHFDMAARRSMFTFDDANFVNVVPKLHLQGSKSEAVWMKASVCDMQTEVQKLTDVGLDFLVEDRDRNEVVCTLCAVVFKQENEEGISIHVRSLEHLLLYLHATNREMFGLVKSQKSARAEHDLLMDYLQRSFPGPGTVRVYSTTFAAVMCKWGAVSYRKVEMCAIDPDLRPVYGMLMDIVDTVADDNVESAIVPIKDAILLANVKVQSIDGSSVLLWCTGCERAFVATESSVAETIWERHLPSALHTRRSASLAKNRLDPNGFLDEKPRFAAPIFDQSASKKKITWRWNENTNVFDYMYCVVGMSDIIDRRSITIGVPHVPDMYCSLCAEVISYSQDWLETHVRSLAHVVSYVHKYYIGAVKALENLQIESQQDSGKMIRKLLGITLKNEYGKAGSMRVYDPEGVMKRKTAEAIKLAEETELQRKKEEAEREREKEILERKKEAELKKRQEEERRESLERQRKRDRERDEEKRRREIERRTREDEERAMKDREQRRKAEQEKKDRRLKEAKKAIEEARRKQRIIAMERQERERRKQEETKRRDREEKEKKEREERALKLKRDVEIARAEHEERERQKVLAMKRELEKERIKLLREQAEQRIKADERRIEMEMKRVQLEKERILENLAAIENTSWRPRSEYPSLKVTVPGAAYEPSAIVYPPEQIDGSIGGPDTGPFPTSRNPNGSFKPTNPVAPSAEMSKSMNRAKYVTYAQALNQITTRAMLVEYLWRQGSEPIPEPELPEIFNSVAARTKGVLGLASVYQVLCWDRPRFESFYCSMCSVWTTASEMFNHLMTSVHRLNHLFRNYKMYHKSASNQTNETARAEMLEQFAQQIFKLEGAGEVRYRLRCVVDYRTVMRLWPEHISFVNDDWMQVKYRTEPITPPPAGMSGDAALKSKDNVDLWAITRKQDLYYQQQEAFITNEQNQERLRVEEEKLRKEEEERLRQENEANEATRLRIEAAKKEAELAIRRAQLAKKQAELEKKLEEQRKAKELELERFRIAEKNREIAERLAKEREKAKESENFLETQRVKEKLESIVKENERKESEKLKKVEEKTKAEAKERAKKDARRKDDEKKRDEAEKDKKGRERERVRSRSRSRRRSRSRPRLSSRRSPSPRSRRSPGPRPKHSPERVTRKSPGHSLHRSPDRAAKRRHRSSSSSSSGRRYHRSKSRSPLRISSLLQTIQSVEPQPEAAWTDAAAAFLAKIGDRQAAEKLRGSTAKRHSGSPDTTKLMVDSPVKTRKRSPSVSPPGVHSPRSRSRDLDMSHARHSLDDRLENERVIEAMNVWNKAPFDANIGAGQARHQGISGVPAPPDTVKRSKLEEQQHRPRDPKEDLRKLLGVLITLQQDTQQRGQIDETAIGHLFKEMGVGTNVATSSSNLLDQLCDVVNCSGALPSTSGIQQPQQPAGPIDLQRFGIAPPKESSAPSLGYIYPGAAEAQSATGGFSSSSPYTGVGGVGNRPVGNMGGFGTAFGNVMDNNNQHIHSRQPGHGYGFPDADNLFPSGISQNGDNAGISPWIAGQPPTGSNVPGVQRPGMGNVLVGGDVFSSSRTEDIYAARRVQGTAIPGQTNYPTDVSSHIVEKAGVAVWEKSSMESGGRPVQNPSHFGQIEKCRNTASSLDSDDEGDVLVIDDRADDIRRKEVQQKRIDQHKQYVESRNLSQWTGANNPANNTSAKQARTGPAAAATISNSNSKLEAPNQWPGWSTQLSVLQQAQSDGNSNMKPAPSNQGPPIDHAPVMPIPFNQLQSNRNFQRKLTRAQRRALKRRQKLGADTGRYEPTNEEELLSAAIEPLEDDDVQILDDSPETGKEAEAQRRGFFSQPSASGFGGSLSSASGWESLNTQVSAILKKTGLQTNPLLSSSNAVQGNIQKQPTQIPPGLAPMPQFVGHSSYGTLTNPTAPYSGNGGLNLAGPSQPPTGPSGFSFKNIAPPPLPPDYFGNRPPPLNVNPYTSPFTFQPHP